MRTRWSAVTLTALAVLAVSTDAQRQQSPDLLAGLDAAAIVEAYASTGVARVRFVSLEQSLAFAKAWKARMARWIDDGPPAEAQRQRRLAALAALELGLTSFDHHHQAGAIRALLFEAAHAGLRLGPPTEFERRWLIATTGLAVFRDGLEHPPTEQHLRAAVLRFPDDGRFRMNQVLTYRDVLTLARLPGTPQSDLAYSGGNGARLPGRQVVGRAEQALIALLTNDDVGAEAHARLAWLRFHQRRLPESLTLFSTAIATATDPFVTNLAALGLGLLHQSQGRLDEATAAFRVGVSASPQSRSAANALAMRLFLSGRREEASALLDGLAGAANALDPWSDVAAADRFVARLRAELRSDLDVPEPRGIEAVPAEATAMLLPPSAEPPVRTPGLPLQRRADFSTTTSMVSVDVAITAGRTPVAGLTAADFVLRDTGVLQTVESVTTEGLDLDVSVVLDMREGWIVRTVSGSGIWTPVVSDPTNQGVADAEGLAALLRPDDRLRVVTATLEVNEPRALTPAGGTSMSRRVSRAGGATAVLYDAVFTALARTTPADRRHLVLVFTDGIDGASIIGSDQLLQAAAMTDAMVVVMRRDTLEEFMNPPGTRQPMILPMQRFLLRPHDATLLPALTEATQGSMERLPPEHRSVIPDARKVIDAFRQRYVLRYRPTGVPALGWHSLEVGVTRPVKFNVLARRGYFGG